MLSLPLFTQRSVGHCAFNPAFACPGAALIHAVASENTRLGGEACTSNSNASLVRLYRTKRINKHTFHDYLRIKSKQVDT